MPAPPEAALAILRRWLNGEAPTASQQQRLLALERTLPSPPPIERRVQHFCQLAPEILQRAPQWGIDLPNRGLWLLWQLWLPLALQLASACDRAHRPIVQGILGLQGTGKTTLAAAVSGVLARLGYRALSLSLDDLYAPYEQRQQLQAQDPRYAWRGPPGTHDVAAGVQVLADARQGWFPLSVPRFDKSARGGAGDRTAPERVAAADLVLFEGWFVGARPVRDRALADAPAPITTDAARAFARDVNRRLSNYLLLWAHLDRLLVLEPSDYSLSKQWRQQAERQAREASRAGMSDAEVAQFVDYFWRSLPPELFVAPLTADPNRVEAVVRVNADRSLGAIYRPGESGESD